MRRIEQPKKRITTEQYDIIEEAIELLCGLCDIRTCRECMVRQLKETAHIAAMRNNNSERKDNT